MSIMFQKIEKIKKIVKEKSKTIIQRLSKKTIFLIIAGVVLLSGLIFIVASDNRGDGPFIYLKMDEGYASTTHDFSGNNNNGTRYGDTTWQNEESCVAGKCLYLDGSGDYLSIPDFSLQ